YRRLISWSYERVVRALGAPGGDPGSIKLARRELLHRPVVARGVFAEGERVIRAARGGARVGEGAGGVQRRSAGPADWGAPGGAGRRMGRARRAGAAASCSGCGAMIAAAARRLAGWLRGAAARLWRRQGRRPRLMLACACAVIVGMYCTNQDMGGQPDAPRGD